MSKKFLIIAGIIISIIGIITIIYAQNQINSSWGYTWTQPYSDFENRIVTIKNVGAGALICGALDFIIVFISYLLKEGKK